MPLIYAEGFELGTSLSEANTMSGNVYSSSGNFTTQTLTFGATSGGTGAGAGARSLQYQLTPNANSTGIFTYLSMPLPGLGAVQATMNSLVWGFRAKANQSWTSPTSGYGASIGIANNAYTVASSTGFYVVRSSGTSGAYISGTGSTNIGPTTGIAVLDAAWHYHTYQFIRTSTTWTINRWLDNTLIGNYTGVSLTWPTTPYFFYHNGVGGTGPTNIFQEIDDMYIGYNMNPLGPVDIRHIGASSDIQAQFTKVGSAGSNFASVDNINLTSGNSLTATSAVEDVYGTSYAQPSGKTIIAVRAGVVANGATSDNIQAKVASGSNSVASAVTPLNATDAVISTGWVPMAVNPADLKYGQAKT